MIEEFQNVVSSAKTSIKDILAQSTDFVPEIILALVTLLIFFFLARIARKGVGKTVNRFKSINANLTKLFESVTFLLVMICGLFAALGILELDKTVTSLLAGAGILGLAISLAFQETIVNVIAGVGIAVREPILPGDLVRVGEHEGWVRGTTMRTTTIRTYTGQDVIIPNKKLYNDVVINFDSSKERRVDIELGVSYADDLEKVQKVTAEALEAVSYADKKRGVDVLMTKFGASSIDLVARLWLTNEQVEMYMQARSEAIINITNAFRSNKITIPYPIRTLDFGDKGVEKLETSEFQFRHMESSNGHHASQHNNN